MNESAEYERIKALTDLLSEAARVYYNENRERMPNLEYDRLYDELAALEQKTGVVLAGSPTQRVGYEVVSDLPKEAHAAPMLSLDKTKDPAALRAWLGDRKGLLSWKLDGLTIALTYQNGAPVKAVTRGNGQVGEVVTASARAFANLPLRIPYKGELTLRGEAVIRYSDFERINAGIEDVALKYKNPRNLCSGSVRQLNSRVTAERRVRFYAFAFVDAKDGEVPDFQNSRAAQMEFLRSQGFSVVEYFETDAACAEERVAWFAERVSESDLPSDGLVLTYDDLAYSASLGSTSKFPRDAIAFKWEDERCETTLREILWSASRTGLINPIALFDPVEIEGSTVSRAGVHNISILEDLQLGAGDRITVYKANMIIPQIAENLTRSGPAEIPRACPVCGGETAIKDESGVRFLCCVNGDCLAKRIKSLSHFVSRDAMNIEGLSEATLEKLVDEGLVKEAADLFRLERFRDRIARMDGFGERSCANLLAAADKARRTTQVRLLYSLGIPGVGLSGAKLICRICGHDWARVQTASREELLTADGIGEVIADAFTRYFENEAKLEAVARILAELSFADAPEQAGGGLFDGRVFVITGGLSRYPNRNALKDLIESLGGKVTGAVTAKTSCLINNDRLSVSAKNKAARSLGVAVIDEAQLAEWIESGMPPADV
ncbi:MAG: NAD-dependent DNA ligase LigA [Clostridiales Family XIII bacterium]|jgi:DNA ligase (NAD+)|nr:NAD-dependent DNA ligase LigA [Clostridiales Family XIII bacterium]